LSQFIATFHLSCLLKRKILKLFIIKRPFKSHLSLKYKEQKVKEKFKRKGDEAIIP
jgi:hypothetical protein